MKIAETCPASVKGMCVANAHLMQVSLNLNDTPVGYAPPVGPAVYFQLSYNHRGATSYAPLGPQWSHNFLAYIEDDTANPGQNVKRVVGGGGYVLQTGYSGSSFAREMQTKARLSRNPATGTATSYTLNFPDGSSHTYGVTATGTPHRLFLSSITDAQGKSLTLAYDASNRLTSIKDATGATPTTGKATTFAYENANPLLITKVTDPFGRFATLTYDGSGRLTSITDVLGITSSFTYDPTDTGFITALNTPYGTSNFAAGGTSNSYRWLELTDPLGATERIEFNSGTSGVADTPDAAPSGMTLPGSGYSLANTFYWDRHANGNLVGQGDYTKAVMTHWLADAQQAASPVPLLTKRPDANPVYFNYPGQTGGGSEGTLGVPSAVGRKIDATTEQVSAYAYNTLGNLTSATDPKDRVSTISYDVATGIDPITLQQKTSASGYSTTGVFGNYTAHLPTSFTDAAGKVWRTAYNAAGQMIYATNPLNQTRFWEYDAQGRMTRATVPVAVAYASVVYGTTNVSAATETSWNYTAACSGVTAPANTNLPISVTDSQGYVLCYQYDAFDRVTKVKYPDGTTEQYDYAFPAGWTANGVSYGGTQSLDLWQVTDRQGRVTSYTYDRNRRLTAKTETLVDPVFVAESGNNRVLVYDVATLTNGKSATSVLGQSSFTTNAAATTAAGLSSPRGVAYDSVNNRLFVADTGNNRVLVYDLATIANGAAAVNVLGQSSFTTSVAATTQAGLNAPEELAYDSGNKRLYVADSGNNRVLVYDVAAITDGENAVNVLGQSSFITSASATSQAGMSGPRGLVYDSATKRLFVAGAGNNRVTVYDVTTITNGENAINVLGQSSFIANVAATTQAGMSGPRGLAYDAGRQRLFVAGNSNHRVTVYDVATITNGENAINVLGQSSFTASTAATTQAGMSAPAALGYDGMKNLLFVTGTGNNRVTVYDVATITNGENAVNVLGQSNFTASTAATTAAGLNAPRGMVYERNTRTTRFSYYKNGVLENMTDAKGVVTHWAIDAASRVTAKVYAYGLAGSEKIELYSYDLAGRLKTVTDALGQVKTIAYDLDNAPLSYTYTKPVGSTLPDTANVTFEYDEFFPRLKTMTDMSGLNGTTGLPAPATTTFAYGALGTNGALQRQSETSSAYYNQHAAWYYDAAGRLTNRWAAESEETFGYDLLGRLNSYGTQLGTFTLGYLGNTGQMTSRSVTDGGVTLSQTYGYDTNANDRRLLSIAANTSAVRSYSYGYATADGVDRFNIRSIAETATSHPLGAQSWVYGYDQGDRLMSAAATAVAGSGASSYGTYSWGYDKLDNAKPIVYPTSEFGGYTDYPEYNALNQQTKNAWWQTFAYDAAGNLTREWAEQLPSHTLIPNRDYKYDMEGRLVEMSDPNALGGHTVRFHYDGMGRRILQKTTSNGTTTYKRYLWCGQTICQQRDTGTNPLRRYLATGEYVNATTAPVAPAKKYVYFQDHLGSVRDLADATTGARVGALDYKPYGAVKASTGVQPDYQYAGLMWVPEVGLNASATRFLDPGTTRWMTRDWDEVAGAINGYSYTDGNPINFTDVFGFSKNVNRPGRGGLAQTVEPVAQPVTAYLFRQTQQEILRIEPNNLYVRGGRLSRDGSVSAAELRGAQRELIDAQARSGQPSSMASGSGSACRPTDGSSMSTTDALNSALANLGPGYRQIAPGVYRSADGRIQVRMTDSDLATSGNHAGAPHMNFEYGRTTVGSNGRQSFAIDQNIHVFLPGETK